MNLFFTPLAHLHKGVLSKTFAIAAVADFYE